jgi:signal transduction histidine kinase
MAVRARTSTAMAAGVAVLGTVLVSVTSLVDFAFPEPSLHVAIDTASACIAAMAAGLVYGRFRNSLELRDLLVTASLASFAAAILLFSVVPSIAASGESAFGTWADVIGRLVAAWLLAAGALVPDRPLRRADHDARRLLGVCALVLASIAVAVAVAAAGGLLPVAVPPDLSAAGATHPRIAGNPIAIGADLTLMLLMAVAATGYTRIAERKDDQATRWLAIAATFGAFAGLNFFLFPTLYSEYVYTGDLLRLCSCLALLVGGWYDMRRTRDVLAGTAVLEERQRIALDLHDGVAQDLSFILQHSRRLAGESTGRSGVRQIVFAAERGLDECRSAIASLVRSGDEPLIEALAVTAQETASREGGRVEMRLEGEVSVPAGTHAALLRVLREAMINAIRHGQAKTIVVEFSEQPHRRLTVIDDGVGFDVVASSGAPGHVGLRGMAARVQAVGGELTVDSKPGSGTRVEVRLP